MMRTKEYDIYLPLRQQSGEEIPPDIMAWIKETLVVECGGYTHLWQPFEGAWQTHGAEVVDRITILRVLDRKKGNFDIGWLKRELQAKLREKEVLIVARDVEIL
jgi:hypothetical protein